MDELTYLIESGHEAEIILAVVAGVLVVQFFVKLFDWFRERFGISSAASRREKEQSKAIAEIEKETKELRETQEADHEEMMIFQKEIKEMLNSIKHQMLDDKIERMRYEILDFSSACQTSERTKEAYDHVLKTYDYYIKILDENNLENGQVELAITYIKKRYSEYLETGFPTY